jgi:hypothetical protein
VAQGSTRLENPSALTSYYGYDNDVLNAAGQPQMLPTPTSATEAQKTEPDKNTYLVFKRSLSGADSSYDYGTGPCIAGPPCFLKSRRQRQLPALPGEGSVAAESAPDRLVVKAYRDARYRCCANSSGRPVSS